MMGDYEPPLASFKNIYGKVWYKLVQFGTMWYILVWYGLDNFGAGWYGTVLYIFFTGLEYVVRFSSILVTVLL